MGWKENLQLGFIVQQFGSLSSNWCSKLLTRVITLKDKGQQKENMGVIARNIIIPTLQLTFNSEVTKTESVAWEVPKVNKCLTNILKGIKITTLAKLSLNWSQRCWSVESHWWERPVISWIFLEGTTFTVFRRPKYFSKIAYVWKSLTAI